MSETPDNPTNEPEATGGSAGNPGQSVDTPKKSRKGLVAVVVAAIAALVVGGGAVAAWQLLAASGPKPEAALPANTLAMLSIDLDPSASQKVEALKTIRKFPGAREELKIEDDADLREWLVDQLVGTEGCDIDFEDDVEPWIGQRAAFAAVPVPDEKVPAPVMAVAISDADGAEAGFQKLLDCAEEGDSAFAVGEEYLIVSSTKEYAEQVLSDGAAKPLADDETFNKWMDEIGDPGILSFYLAPELAGTAVDLLADEFGELAPADAEAATWFEDFSGAAGSFRFADGGVEFIAAVGGLNEELSEESVGDAIGMLPEDSTLALGFSVSEDYAEDLANQEGAASLLQEAESFTGLDLPQDLGKLLGSAVTLSVGGDAPDPEVFDPTQIQVGLVLHTDAKEARAIIARAEERIGFELASIPITLAGEDDCLAISPSPDYAAKLIEAGDLADADTFGDVVPDAADANGVFYLNGDSDWVDFLAEITASGPDDAEEFRKNAAPLRAIGAAVWSDGDMGRIRVKLATAN